MPPKRQRAETATSAEEPKRRSTRNTRSSAAETTTPEETKPATTTTRKSAAKKAEPKKKSPAASAAPAEKKDEPKPTATSDDDSAAREPRFWLLKAEPETRIEKGKDVKFSIDDLAAMKEPAAWDGGKLSSSCCVGNHETMRRRAVTATVTPLLFAPSYAQLHEP